MELINNNVNEVRSMTVDMYNQSTFLVVKAAYMYYITGLPQSEIADELSISITTVSRLLKRAKEEKIIEFVIRDPFVECLKLEKNLREIFGLKDVIIAPALSCDDDDQIRIMLKNWLPWKRPGTCSALSSPTIFWESLGEVPFII
jgi:DNA-binding transcriptional regulator LsrR (DeoR family)